MCVWVYNSHGPCKFLRAAHFMRNTGGEDEEEFLLSMVLGAGPCPACTAELQAWSNTCCTTAGQMFPNCSLEIRRWCSSTKISISWRAEKQTCWNTHPSRVDRFRRNQKFRLRSVGQIDTPLSNQCCGHVTPQDSSLIRWFLPVHGRGLQCSAYPWCASGKLRSLLCPEDAAKPPGLGITWWHVTSH